MGTLDRLLRERHERGLAEGEAHLRSALRKLQTQRFGELSATTLAQLERAGLQQLEGRTERLLDVASVDELFLD